MLPFSTASVASFLETGASYIGGQFDFATSNAINTMGSGGNSPAAGDLLIIWDAAGSSSVTMSNGAALTNFSATGGTVYWRVLVSGDLTATVTGTASGRSCVIYRSAASVAQVDSDTSAGAASSKDAGGYTKNGAHAGMLCIVQSTTASATVSVAAPAAFATRGNVDPSGISINTQLICDRLQPASPYYVSLTSVIWNSSGASNTLAVLELRS